EADIPLDLDPSTATGTDDALSDSSLGFVAGHITASGSVLVGATNTGQIIAVVLAAAVSAKTNNAYFTGAGWGSVKEGTALAKFGTVLSGDVVVDVITDHAEALVSGALISAGGLDV